MNLFDRLNKTKNKTVTARKFLSPKGVSCISWAVEKDCEARLTIRDEHKSVVFTEWFGDVDDRVAFDKKLGVIVDEITAFRKATKANK
jgi:hypothetical protein